MKERMKRWDDIKARGRTPERVAALEREARAKLFDMDLRQIREFVGKSQEEMAALLKTTQSQVSRLENRDDHKLSTLRRIADALGAQIEIVFKVGPKSLHLAV